MSINGEVRPGDLFVFYGLLKQGAAGAPSDLPLAAAGTFGAPCRFRGAMYDLGGFPGVVAGSIFTFSLTLGDYIVPQVVGTSHFFIGQAVYSHQGTAGNIPLAAAFTVVPIVIMGIYLTLAKRAGAFNAL